MNDRLAERLRKNADLTEKALDFMAHPEQVEEAKADIALWRKAAADLTATREALDKAVGVMETAVAELPLVRESRSFEYVDDAVEAMTDAIAEARRLSGGEQT